MVIADDRFDSGYNPGGVAEQAPVAGSGNTFSGEHWTKSAGSMADCVLPFTGSTYADCDFHLPVPVSFPANASGTDNVFDHGSTGGTFY